VVAFEPWWLLSPSEGRCVMVVVRRSTSAFTEMVQRATPLELVLAWHSWVVPSLK